MRAFAGDEVDGRLENFATLSGGLNCGGVTRNDQGMASLRSGLRD